MRIIYKNGHEQTITEQMATILRDNLTGKGCGNFQCFSDENGKVLTIINLSEIACVQPLK